MRLLARLLLALAALLALGGPARAEDTGRFVEVEHLAVSGLPEQRLTIWLPPGYDAGKRRYGVLYMHDGQNLFFPDRNPWNKAWAVDKALSGLVAAGRVDPVIVVGVWSPGADRWRQYLPYSAWQAASPQLRGLMEAMNNGLPVVSQRYVDWLALELKPWIDRTYRTRRGRDDTAIAGSSMGGLVSCYAFMRHPRTYGRAACISAHWPASDPRASGAANPELKALWDGWFKAGLSRPRGRRLWLDHGTATLDAYYAPYQDVVDVRLAAQGWQRGRDFESRVYEGAEHEENAWARRLPEVLGWLLRKN